MRYTSERMKLHPENNHGRPAPVPLPYAEWEDAVEFALGSIAAMDQRRARALIDAESASVAECFGRALSPPDAALEVLRAGEARHSRA